MMNIEKTYHRVMLHVFDNPFLGTNRALFNKRLVRIILRKVPDIRSTSAQTGIFN